MRALQIIVFLILGALVIRLCMQEQPEPRVVEVHHVYIVETVTETNHVDSLLALLEQQEED